jgi:hypothetical protein
VQSVTFQTYWSESEVIGHVWGMVCLLDLYQAARLFASIKRLLLCKSESAMQDNRKPARIICSDPQLAEQVRKLFMVQAPAAQVICDALDCHEAPLCRWLGEQHLGEAGKVQATLAEVVELLNSTRHAFKSREVGRARLRLRELMMEISGSCE